jgi:hypothetical protein
VLYELDDPTALTLCSKRMYSLSQDPYVRASYFLVRYGTQQALFHALGRGKLLSPAVIDVRALLPIPNRVLRTRARMRANTASGMKHQALTTQKQRLLSAGAHLSRYLIQIALGHYFRGHAPFVKTAWVRTVPFPAFAHLLGRAAVLFGHIPVDKGADDGSTLGRFVAEARLPPAQQSVSWETVQEIMETYKVRDFFSPQFGASPAR